MNKTLSMKTLKIFSFILLLPALFFSCQKEYSFEGVVTPAGTWRFNDDTKLYVGNIDTAYIETTGATKTLNLIGRSTDGTQTFLLHLYATGSFTTGEYKASLFQSDFQYSTPSKTFYQADQFVGEFIVTITALGNNSITGIFSGDSEDSTGTIKPLTLGQFTSRLNLTANGGGGGGGTALGTLGASAGVCSPASTTGTFTQGVALTSANTATVQVNVTTAGTYTISTNTVNGVTFTSSGTFTTTGVQNVILTGSGIPAASGSQTYVVTFGSSTCNFPITFGAGGPAATGTLGGGPGACTPSTQAGTYTQGVALTSSNTVQVQVNVTTAGSYTISTNTVNAVSFSASGTFAATGAQNVTLTGTGTPASSGAQNFTVTFGSSSCTFTITFAPGSVPAGDYFPTTSGSYWAYGNNNPADSFLITATSNTKVVGPTTYNVFTLNSIPSSGPNDELYYRKAGGEYYEYFDAEAFYGFDPGTTNPKNIEYSFLKEAANVNDTWQSPSVTGVSSGTSITVYMKMTLLAKAVSATSGIVTSTDVMKVRYEYFASAAGIPAFVILTEERWFARGKGVIYNSFDEGLGPDIYRVGRLVVN